MNIMIWILLVEVAVKIGLIDGAANKVFLLIFGFVVNSLEIVLRGGAK